MACHGEHADEVEQGCDLNLDSAGSATSED